MNPMDVEIITVTAGANSRLEAVRSLFSEYEQFLSIELSFQEFEKELARLPGKYTAPDGVLLLALVGEETAGCAAFRKHERDICEMKRLYVKPTFRGRGIGKRLACEIIDRARKTGYTKMVLDTLPMLHEATCLYDQLGFEKCSPYNDNPLPEITYWKLNLQKDAENGTKKNLFKG